MWHLKYIDIQSRPGMMKLFMHRLLLNRANFYHRGQEFVRINLIYIIHSSPNCRVRSGRRLFDIHNVLSFVARTDI